MGGTWARRRRAVGPVVLRRKGCRGTASGKVVGLDPEKGCPGAGCILYNSVQQISKNLKFTEFKVLAEIHRLISYLRQHETKLKDNITLKIISIVKVKHKWRSDLKIL